MSSTADLEIVKAHIASYPDFPKPGILFRDMFPILQSPIATAALINLLVQHVQSLDGVAGVIALESRGFLLAPFISSKLGLPLIPVRKKGKLPGKIRKVEYALEYGTDTVEMQDGSLKPGQKVIVVDDLLATGGTAKAACQLIEELGGEIVQLIVLMEISELKGREKIPCDVHSFIKF